jgi:hypothetical protein
VTNTGNVDLTNIDVTDSVGGVNPEYQSGDDGDEILEVGESWIYTASGISQSAHLGQYDNIGTVAGVYQLTEVEASDPSWYIPTDVDPVIEVVKTGTATINEGGSSITYTFTITNNSVITDPVTITSIDDDKFGDLLATAEAQYGGTIVLAGGGGSFMFTYMTSLTLDGGETHTNVVTVEGVDDEGSTDDDDDDHTVTGVDVLPAIQVIKSVDQPMLPSSGGMVTYTYLVTNESPAAATDPLSDVMLSDTDGTPTYVSGDDGDDLLEEGETWTYSMVVNLPGQAAGTSHTNTATVSGYDDEENYAEDEDDETVTFVEPSQLTNTEYCSFDYDTNWSGNQFRLMFLMDAPQSYRLNGRNPGQFYYNVFVSGTPGSAVDVRIDVPYPFVTKGAVPIHVYRDFAIAPSPYGVCYDQVGDVTGSFMIDTENGNRSSSGQEIILLSDYDPQALGSTEWIRVQGTMPATGWIYVTVHLDYGLVGTSGWTRTITQTSPFEIDTATNAGLGVLLAEPQSYNFSFVAGAQSDTDVGQSVNQFKKEAGVSGTILDAMSNPAPGILVTLKNASRVVVGSDVTDSDGCYTITYKHTGPARTYRVTATQGAWTKVKTITLRANGYALVNFTVGEALLGAAAVEAGSAVRLTPDSLQPAVDKAIAYWTGQGIDEAVWTRLGPIDGRITDLPGDQLGLAYTGSSAIQIDVDAAGRGWDQVDLLSVVTHEIGHLLGFDHDVLGESLLPGQRFMPVLQPIQRDHDHQHDGLDEVFEHLGEEPYVEALVLEPDSLLALQPGRGDSAQRLLDAAVDDLMAMADEDSAFQAIDSTDLLAEPLVATVAAVDPPITARPALSRVTGSLPRRLAAKLTAGSRLSVIPDWLDQDN